MGYLELGVVEEIGMRKGRTVYEGFAREGNLRYFVRGEIGVFTSVERRGRGAVVFAVKRNLSFFFFFSGVGILLLSVL